MTIIFMGILILFVTISVPGNFGMSPHTIQENFGREGPLPLCREETESERLLRGGKILGKAALFSLDHEYLCERYIFPYGERDEYINFVLGKSENYAAYVGRQTRLLTAHEKSLEGKPWVVQVESPDHQLSAQLLSVFQTALFDNAANTSVLNGTVTPEDALVILIEVRAVSDPGILFHAKAKSKVSDGKVIREVQWTL
jgi:hypothetical protein